MSCSAANNCAPFIEWRTYYTAVPDDPPDDNLNLYINDLKGLIPSGRGTYLQDDDDRELPGSEWF
jgi:hypothetical protein